MTTGAWASGDRSDEPAGAALVISLDFELHWGVRDIHGPSSPYTANLLGARDAIPRMLDLFVEFEVAATWSTVGFLFAESRDELEAFRPAVRPAYEDPRLDPYGEPVGRGEADDPLHFAPSLIRAVAATPRQEVGTHTYSHFYCAEPGASAEAFRHDLASAVGIGRARGIAVRSLVLPRNQWVPSLAPVVREAGIVCVRGNQRGSMYAATPFRTEPRSRRIARLADAHLPITRWDGAAWTDVHDATGLHDVPATCFLRPVGNAPRVVNELRLRRIVDGLAQAAARGRIFHLWWHPHNFGRHAAENLAFLRRVLERYRALRDERGMRSLSMVDVADFAARAEAVGA